MTRAMDRARRGPRRRLRTVVALAVGLVLAAPVAASASPYPYPFRDPHLPLNARIADLVSRLTLPEKVSLLHQYEPAIPRLGVPSFKTGTEALHGVAWSTDINNNGAVVTANGTVFPQAVGLASTWDPALIKQVGNAVGQEARGFNAENPAVWGLNLWAPVTNLLRDPRWGRNEEGYSEDPYLTSQIATAYGSGIEGDNPTYLQAAPTLKHYLAYNNEVNRDTSDSIVPPAILHDYDQQAFEPALAANAATGVMASYNLVNGRPNTVDPDLATTERSWSSKALMNVTDAGAPNNLTGSEAYYPTQAQADAAAIKAGIDSFTTDDTNSSITITAVEQALQQGLLTEADVDKADSDILAIRFRLGDFDPPGANPYANITPAVINSPAHQQLERQAADEQLVLLRNANNALPLNAASTKKVAVVGPLENTLYTDWYSGSLPYQVTPLQGITQRLGSGGSVAASEGADRIALQDIATGQYLTASTASAGAPLVESGSTAGAAQSLDVFDWGSGIVTLRTVANNKYLTLGGTHDLVNSEAQPNGWFVQQQFKLDAQPDGSVVLEYAGNDASQSWFGPNKYAVAGSDGTVTIGAATIAAATHFRKNVLTSGVDSAVAAAKGADAAVVVVGSMPFINGREADDRSSTALPDAQEALIKAVQAANPHTIVVLENSYPDTINWEQANVPAILHTTHAGAETGHALADVLFGDYDPSGRLTQTWYASDAGLPSITDYDIAKTGLTYQYYQGKPLYPFGYGLSYTSFAYSNLRLSSPQVNAKGQVRATVDVTNTGSRAGTDVVQLYTHELASRSSTQPDEQLRAFGRVTLNPHQTKPVTLTLNAADLKFWDVTQNRYVVESGAYQIKIGPDADDTALTAPLSVHGEVIPPRDLTKVTEAQNFDDYSGITLTDYTKAAGTSVASTAPGNWISFADTCIPAAVHGLTAEVSNPGTSDVHVAVRLDNPNSGPTIGTLDIPGTGGHYNYATVSTALAGLPGTGTHTVYLVFDGVASVHTFNFTR
ncbi:MAG TPA: glycoside hydrolase family 3 C-terminal domain-containing protein [Pseudonocardiaceae bacterium]|nr:glycoside hydrolase family 3 C-terminal domain-containing protein [Pseudonocardiaceae bacterium]